MGGGKGREGVGMDSESVDLLLEVSNLVPQLFLEILYNQLWFFVLELHFSIHFYL